VRRYSNVRLRIDPLELEAASTGVRLAHRAATQHRFMRALITGGAGFIGSSLIQHDHAEDLPV
jgi:hypothetical protein